MSQMAISPYGAGQMSAQQMAQTVLLQRLASDGTEQDTAKMLLVELGTRSAENIARTLRNNAESNADVLDQLKELGFNKKSELVKEQIGTQAQMNDVILDIGRAIPRLLRRH